MVRFGSKLQVSAVGTLKGPAPPPKIRYRIALNDESWLADGEGLTKTYCLKDAKIFDSLADVYEQWDSLKQKYKTSKIEDIVNVQATDN